VQAPKRRAWRWWRIALVLLVIVIGAPVALLLWSSYTTRSAWEQAEAEAAGDLPRWRLLEMEADRPVIPDAENSALHMIAMRKKAGRVSVGGVPNYETIFEKLTPTAQLNRQQSDLIRGELAKIAGPLAEARKLKDMPRGRIPIVFSDDAISTLIPHHQDTREIGDWLQHDAMLLAQDEEYDKAVESCQAILNAGRALDGDPFLIALLIRLTLQRMAIISLERVLAQGQASEESLRDMQAMLDRDIKQSSWLAAVRGERGMYHQLFDNIRQGKIDKFWLAGMRGPNGRAGGGFTDELALSIGERFPSTLLKYYPEFLGYMNRCVEAAKLPTEERLAKIQELDAEVRATRNPVTRLLAPSLIKVGQAELRSQAMLRSSMVAVACERYRLRHRTRDNENAWPATLEDLVKDKLLDAVPADPFDGKPLRYRRTRDGIVVYSVGLDLTDNNGHIDRDRVYDPGVDIGFRLWDVGRRRQPALPSVAVPGGE
jgi:hypothetical protein